MQWESDMFNNGNARQPPELMHYGILGQKWGLRRFQNEDRSLTPAGKERYGRGNSEKSGKNGKTGNVKAKKKDKKVKEEAQKKQEGKDRSEWKAKDVRELSDAELKRRNNRLQQEQNYKNNTTPQWKKDAKQFAKNNVQEAVKNILIGTAATALAAVMAKNYKKAGPIIAKASKTAFNKIKNHRNVIKSAANQYASNNRKSSTREYSYKPNSHHGFGVSQDWPSVNTKGNKSGKKTRRR